MSIPVIVVGDITGQYISAIEKQRGEVSVARHVQDFAELLGLAQTGIARAVLIVGEHQEFTLTMAVQLLELDLGVVVMTDPDSELKQIPHVTHISTLDDDQVLLGSLEASVHRRVEMTTFDGAPREKETHDSHKNLSSTQSGNTTVEPYETAAQQQRQGRGKIITFLSGHGAPGRSTLAVNCAAWAAEQGLSVCLVDADTYAPSVSALLGMLEDYSGLSQLCHLAERAQVTEQQLDDAIGSIKLSSHYLHIVSGVTRADRWPEIRPQPFAQVLETLKRRYDVIFVDTAPHLEEDEELSFDGLAPRRNAATITALEEADHVVMVGSADVLGIPRTIRAFEDVRELVSHGRCSADISVWVNKMRKHSVGTSPEQSISAAWERFGPQQPISGFIPYDQTTIDRSWLTGKTLVEFAPKSDLTLALGTMTDTILQRNPCAVSDDGRGKQPKTPALVTQRIDYIEEPEGSATSRLSFTGLRRYLSPLSRKK